MPELNLGRPGLSVLPLGVGDAFSAIHHPTSMLVSRYTTPAWDNDLVLIDCPQSIRKMMREADDGRFHGLDLHRINTLILTHLHTDHASGLETLAAFFKIAVGRKLRLVALPEVLAGVPRFLEAIKSLGTMEDLFDVVELHPGEGNGVQFGSDEKKLLIEARKTLHPIPTCGLRIEHQDRRLAYSCDTTFDRTLWEWLWADPRESGVRPADLVIHEVGHGIHTSYDDLANAMQKTVPGAGVAELPPSEKLRLTHYPDDMLPMLEASPFKILREGKLEIV